MSVPVIDLSAFLHDDAAGQAEAARRIDEALRTVGFFSVVGHGVDPGLVAEMTDASRRFFDLPMADKLACIHPQGGIGRGYVPFGGEANGRTLHQAAAADAKEQIAFGRFDVPDSAYYRQPFAQVAFQPNVLPPQPPGYAGTARRYYEAMQALAQRLLRALATALQVRADFFDDKFDHHTSVMRVLNYPDQAGLALAPGQLRSGEHTDFGSLTLLLADRAPGGLQVRLRNGEWVDVLPPEGGFIVNIGDLMAVWTNDRWVSNLHRVANPPDGCSGSTRRLSIAYFVHANYDALIECIPSCQAPGQPARHAPVLAGEHRLMKVRLASGATGAAR